MQTYTPKGWPQVIPRLCSHDPEATVQFLRLVFDATGDYNSDRPSEIWLGQCLIMVGGIVERSPSSAFTYVYVADTDKAYAKALELGAKSVEVPQEMPYGDRRAMVDDPWGNCWQIATHREFKPHGTA